MATESTSPGKPQVTKGNAASGQARSNKQYSFKDEHVVSLFKLLYKSNKLKLPEAKRPEEVGKTDDPNYCIYHRMVGHPTKSCFIFKDVLQALIDAEVLKLRPEQKKVTANTVFLQFGIDLPPVQPECRPFLKENSRLSGLALTIRRRRG